MTRGAKILITGTPGSGKTTLFKRLVQDLSHFNPRGFYTSEIRKGGTRTGFRLKSLDGRHGILAHTEFRTGYRVGKYRVDLEGFEAFLGPYLLFDPSTGLVMIDEIGKMECLSAVFQKWIRQVFESPNPIVATIAQKGGGLIAELKSRPDARLFMLTRENQEDLFEKICSILSELESWEGGSWR
jgi:nucleoside-triphosphatase